MWQPRAVTSWLRDFCKTQPSEEFTVRRVDREPGTKDVHVTTCPFVQTLYWYWTDRSAKGRTDGIGKRISHSACTSYWRRENCIFDLYFEYKLQISELSAHLCDTNMTKLQPNSCCIKFCIAVFHKVVCSQW